MKNFILTFDIDWAPNFAIEHCLDLLDISNTKATFFTTHETPLNTEITSRGHILGIHPNFLPNSSQGKDTASILKKCLTFAPEAWCMRTHALVQSTPLFYEIFTNFPQIRLDVSLLMHRSSYAHKCIWEFNGVSAERLMYNWEDDAEFSEQRFGIPSELFFGKLTVCDFHPIHVFLNSSNGSEYNDLKSAIHEKSLFEITKAEAAKYINKGAGVETHLKSLLSANAVCLKLDEI